MRQGAERKVEVGVIEVLRSISPRTIEPTLESDLFLDLGFDSVRVLEAVAALEDRFDISINLNDVPTARSVGQVVALVAALIAARSESPAS